MRGRSPSALRTVSALAAVATYLLIVLGAVVRASGSGLGCPDWPLCYGQPIPPGYTPAIIEYSHRAWGAVVSLLILATLVLWARAYQYRPDVVLKGVGILALLVLQIALGAITVKNELPPYVVALHLGMAMILFGILIALAVTVRLQSGAVGETPSPKFTRLAWGASGAVFLLLLLGTYVRASGATGACIGFPTCNGAWLPLGVNRLIDIHIAHRLLALLVAAHLTATVIRAWRHERNVPAVGAIAGAVAVGLVAQLGIGIWVVSSGFPPTALVLHVAGAGALWGSTVALLAATLHGGKDAVVSGGASTLLGAEAG
ncbi:MAG: heme synthase [Chloroflexi bacterium]|nr:heme synthase [Chloroflexota bacterium]